jgi:hypothetical protein
VAQHKHGITAYTAGERKCPKCRAAWADYMRARRRRQVRRTGRTIRRRRSYYTNKTPFRTALSPLGERILSAAARRSGKALDDIVEQLVREYGPAVAA